MKNIQLILVFFSVSLISISSLTVPISAQYTASTVEQLLELAKRKLEQIKPEFLNSSVTLDQFRNHLSNMTLSQEQTTEVDVIHDVILIPCAGRISAGNEPGKLCDAFADYLTEKCKRFDNLLIFCNGGLLGQYELTRNNQLAENELVAKLKSSCTNNPPAYNDIITIRKCLKLGALNSSYYNKPPQFSATISNNMSNNYATEEDNYTTIYFHITVKNQGVNPLKSEVLKYGLYKDDKKLKEGCIGRPVGCTSPNDYTIQGLGSEDYEFQYTTGINQSATLGVPPYVINGTYYYFNPNSIKLAKPFNLVVN